MFEPLFSAIRDTHKTLIVYTTETVDPTLATRLDTQNVTVDHRILRSLDHDGFVIVRDEERFLGAFSLQELLRFLSPPVRKPWELDSLDPAYRAIFDLLDNTVFVSLDRRQLLATSREIEDRAWRVGRGTLYVGFQSLSAFEKQQSMYRQLAETTAIDVHIYLAPDQSADELGHSPVTIHTDSDADVGRYWFLLFDGGGTEAQKCALVARQDGPETYRGFWTYDPELVDMGISAVVS